MAQEVSWRTAFQSCGYIGVGYAVVLIALLGNAPTADTPAQQAEAKAAADNEKMNWLGFIVLLLCFALPSLPGWAVKNWLPTLLQDNFHMDQKSSGMWATSVAASAGFFGVLIGGKLADVMSKRDIRGRTWVSATGLFLLIPALLGIGMAPSFVFAIIATGLYGIAFGMFDTNNMPILCQVVPQRARAMGYGVLNFAGIGAGALLTPMLGKLKDSGVPLSQGFAYCSIPVVIACVLMLSLRPRSNG